MAPQFRLRPRRGKYSQHLMEQRGLKQADLVGVFGTPSIVSEVLSGKREMNARQARRLADFFDLTADLFV